MPQNSAPTFISNGMVRTDFFGFFDTAYDVIIQQDGKIIVIGTSGNLYGTGDDFALARYNSDGSLDGSFGIDGKVTTTLGNVYESAYSAVLQPDGKIVLAGYTGDPSWGDADFSLVRYNPDGSLDTSFGGDGIVITEFGVLASALYDITIQSDGKLLVVGSALARYNTDGSLDTSFGNNGTVTGSGGSSIFIQPDGKVVVAGTTTSISGDYDFALSRFNSDGSLDNSFGINGKVITDFNGSYDKLNDVVLQSDGKILAVGSRNNHDFALARYNPDGSLDTSFGDGGKLTTDFFTWSDIASSVTLQPDGKIIVAGEVSTGLGVDFGLIRYNSDGSLDQSFGSGGKVITDTVMPNSYDYDGASSVTVQPDGKIVVVGSDGHDFYVLRYNPDGSLDQSFGGIDTLGSSATYNEGGAAVLLDEVVRIFDAELAVVDNYSGASVILSRHGGPVAEDVFSAGYGYASIDGGYAYVGNIIIGTANYNSGALAITFNENATQARVDLALSSITYSNSSELPPESVLIDWLFDDGTGASTTGTSTVNIISRNDTPFLVEIPAFTYTDTPEFDNFSVSSGMLVGVDLNNDQVTYDISGGTVTGDISSLLGVYGTLEVNRYTGAVTYIPNDIAINNSIVYTQDDYFVWVSDGISGGTWQLSIDIFGTNETPIPSYPSGNNKLILGSEDDTVNTWGGNDIINAGAGNNAINAGDGKNKITADDGEDIIIAGSDNDIINAGAGDNAIDAGDGKNKITTGDGNDIIIAGSGNDIINAGAGDNAIDAGDGKNKITTGDGNDIIIAGSGNDTIYAGAGNNLVDLGAGNDKVIAGSGNDIIVGGSGKDTLTGGAGNDYFVLDNLAVGGVDTIKDFSSLNDILVFDSSVFTSLADGFTADNLIVGSGSVAQDSNDFLIFRPIGGKLYYDADGNGAGAAIQIVTLMGVNSLDISNFIVDA